MNRSLLSFLTLLAGISAPSVQSQTIPSDYEWSDAFGSGFIQRGAGFGVMTASTDHVYARGLFLRRDGGPVRVERGTLIVRWSDRDGWEQVPGQFAGFGPSNGGIDINAMYHDGAHLYVGGRFSSVDGVEGTAALAKWDGSEWSSVGGGVPSANAPGAGRQGVDAIYVSGGIVYVGGDFTDAGGNEDADYLAQWDGSAWSALGAGVEGPVLALEGDGARVVVAGTFTGAGGIDGTTCVASWDGAAWSDIGGGVTHQQTDCVRTIALSSGRTCVAGTFSSVPGSSDSSTVTQVACWNGSQWESTGLRSNWRVDALAFYDDQLCATGSMTDTIEGAEVLACWTEDEGWETLRAEFDTFGGFASDGSFGADLTVYKDQLYALGSFVFDTNSFGAQGATYNMLRWNGEHLNPVSTGFNGGVSSVLRATISGTSGIYVAGGFTNVGGDSDLDYVVRWDGAQWQALGQTNPMGRALGSISDMAVSGDDLYVVGSFESFAGVDGADGIARWDGSEWQALGSGIDVSRVLSGNVAAVSIGADGSVYVGGTFVDAGGRDGADGIARWDGFSWQPLGSGVRYEITDLAAGQDGLFVAGNFPDLDGVAQTAGFARWDGRAWRAVGAGLASAPSAVEVLGEDVYVAGDLFLREPSARAAVAHWDGSRWRSLTTNGYGSALAFDSKGILYGGTRSFSTDEDEVSPGSIGRWVDDSWEVLGPPLDAGISALLPEADRVYAGGSFTATHDSTLIMDRFSFLSPSTATSQTSFNTPSGPRISFAGPNPFRSETRLRVAGLADGEQIEAALFDALGRRVRELPTTQAGDEAQIYVRSSGLGSGLYFVLVQAGEDRFVRAVTFLP